MRFIGHVPFVRLPHGQEQMTLPTGMLRRLPFDEWHALDGTYPFQGGRYDDTDPTFFELEVPRTADAVDRFGQGRDAGAVELARLYRALLLTTTAPLAVPDLSVSYLVTDDTEMTTTERELLNRAVMRRVGPCDRELIVFGGQHPYVTLDEAAHAGLVMAHGLLGRTCEPIEPLLHALVWTTRPGFTALNEALHLLAGLEALLVAPGEPLTATFGRRFAVLTATGDPREHEALGRRLYALRSDLVHGRPVRPADDPEPYYRGRVCRMALRALGWFADRSGAAARDFHEALDRAYHRGGTS